MPKHSQSEVLGEIERLDGELQRISRELDALRRRVDGPTRTGRTQAFAGVAVPSLPPLPPPSGAPLSITPATTPSPSARAHAMGAAPSSRPRPSPTIPPKTGTRPISERSAAEGAAANSSAAQTGRRIASPSVGLEHEPSSPPRGRESPSPREAGRYEFVQDAKPRSSTRR